MMNLFLPSLGRGFVHQGRALGSLILLLLQLQCSWTPTVKTPIFTGQQGRISLQTSTAFKVPPAHPAILPETVVRELLQGLTFQQGTGILQELLTVSSETSPVFSPKQIDFLASHLVPALSKATPEELVEFSCEPMEERDRTVRGTVAVFSDDIFFLTLEHAGEPAGSPYPLSPKQQSPRHPISLHFASEEASAPLSLMDSLMHIPQQTPWIGVYFHGIPTRTESQTQHSNEPGQQPGNSDRPLMDDANIQRLEKQVEGLQRRIEEQQEEIRRMQDSTP